MRISGKNCTSMFEPSGDSPPVPPGAMAYTRDSNKVHLHELRQMRQYVQMRYITSMASIGKSVIRIAHNFANGWQLPDLLDDGIQLACINHFNSKMYA